MIRLAARGLLGRRTSSALAAAGLATAIIGFLLLAGTARTTQAQLTGDIGQAWDTPYDILVRPAGTQTTLEAQEGLVRPNFISGIGGGITDEQLQAIRQIPDVSVAAPIAVVGFVQWPAGFPLDLRSFVGGGSVTVLRITTTTIGEAGLSQYPSQPPTYLVVAPQGRVVQPSPSEVGLPSGPKLEVGDANIACTATVVCYGGLTPNAYPVSGLASDTPGVYVPWSEPIVVAGVDPAAEAQLAGLDHCVTEGRYLQASDGPGVSQSPAGAQPTIPVLVSTQSFIDESVSFDIERAADPGSVLSGTEPAALAAWAPVATRTATANDAYQAYLQTINTTPYYDASPHWIVGPVTYQQIGPDHLIAKAQVPDPGIYQSKTAISPGGGSLSLAPPEAADTWFRSVSREDQIPGDQLFSRWQPVGEYDPNCLPGFNPLAGGRLEAYGLPQITLSNGKSLGPMRSLASYVNSPPLVLTTLSGARWLSDPSRFEGAPGAAYISVVRVKVAGVTDPGSASEARLATTAARIHDATGLQVDIVKGSSPRTVLVDLPAGNFGRPAITVSEEWSVKGVALGFVNAVSAQNLAVLVLVLLGATLLVAETSFLAVRGRSTELGVLRAIGWSRWRVATLAEIEMLLLGLVVGMTATGLVAALSLVGLVNSPWQLIGATPLAGLVAILGGLPPALAAFRGRPIDVLDQRERPHRGVRARSITRLAIHDIFGARTAETLVAMVAIALGSSLVGAVALVAFAFQDQLDSTILGQYISGQVRPFHLAIAMLTVVIGTITAAEIASLAFLRRDRAFAVLRAIGWSNAVIVRFLIIQGLVVGMLAALLAGVATVVLALILGAAQGPTEASVGVACLATIPAGLAAAIGPILVMRRSRPMDVLRGE